MLCSRSGYLKKQGQRRITKIGRVLQRAQQNYHIKEFSTRQDLNVLDGWKFVLCTKMIWELCRILRIEICFAPCYSIDTEGENPPTEGRIKTGAFSERMIPDVHLSSKQKM